jgi:uncharacterized protein YjiS (DUF1127 family)
MTPHATAPSQPLAFARVSYAQRAWAAASKLWTIWRNRRDFRRLGELNDLELADIGLRRSDLMLVSELPLSEDPTTRLGMLARRNAR